MMRNTLTTAVRRSAQAATAQPWQMGAIGGSTASIRRPAVTPSSHAEPWTVVRSQARLMATSATRSLAAPTQSRAAPADRVTQPNTASSSKQPFPITRNAIPASQRPRRPAPAAAPRPPMPTAAGKANAAGARRPAPAMVKPPTTGKATTVGQGVNQTIAETRQGHATASPTQAVPHARPGKGLTEQPIPAAKATETTAAPKTLSQKITALWDNIKYLFRFYVNGVKQIWKDRALVRAKREEVRQRIATGQGEILWTEKAMIELHESDVRKLPLFLAILIVLEEILPLVVIYAPSLLPSTCILPSQSLKMRAASERRRAEAIQRLANAEGLRALVERVISSTCHETVRPTREQGTTPTALSQLSATVIKDLAAVFDLRTWGTAGMVSGRLEQHLQTLQEDDRLLQHAYRSSLTAVAAGADAVQPNQWQTIVTSDWLWRACGRRGIRSSEDDASTMQRNLEAYLHLVPSVDPKASDASVLQQSLIARATVPLALYDGSIKNLDRLKDQASEDQSKGLRRRTKEVVQDVVQEEKRKEGVE